MRRFGTCTRLFVLTVRTTIVITLPLALIRRTWIRAVFLDEAILTIRTRLPFGFVTRYTDATDALFDVFAAATLRGCVSVVMPPPVVLPVVPDVPPVVPDVPPVVPDV